MDLSRIAALHPTLDPELRLLVLELDHGKANEISGEQLGALDALAELLETSDIACLCTTSRRVSGRGTPIFISGANVSERVGWDDERVRAHVVRQRDILRRLRHAPVFTTVVTHGVSFGWGTEFLLTADYCLATPTARFALPETGLGILPGARGTAELALHIGPAHALRLGCTGEEIDTREALRIGLVHSPSACAPARPPPSPRSSAACSRPSVNPSPSASPSRPRPMIIASPPARQRSVAPPSAQAARTRGNPPGVRAAEAHTYIVTLLSRANPGITTRAPGP